MNVDPEIASWARLWLTILWIGVGLFAVLSVYVIVAGFRDILQMFADLRRQGADAERDDP